MKDKCIHGPFCKKTKQKTCIEDWTEHFLLYLNLFDDHLASSVTSMRKPFQNNLEILLPLGLILKTKKRYLKGLWMSNMLNLKQNTLLVNRDLNDAHRRKEIFQIKCSTELWPFSDQNTAMK